LGLGLGFSTFLPSVVLSIIHLSCVTVALQVANE